MLTTDAAAALAERLLAAHADGSLLEPISAARPDFGLADAAAVRAVVTARRRDAGWVPVGRKIGFTNRTIWPRYGVSAPLWAPVWDRTLVRADDGTATVDLGLLPQPRIEPEVVFGVRDAVPATLATETSDASAATEDGAAVLAHAEWMAAGFEIVQCPFPEWRFTLPDGTAAFGLHGRLVVGRRVPLEGLDAAAREELADRLTSFEVTLSRDGEVVDRGVGANVMGSPALALGHLAAVLDGDGDEPMAAGEAVTTGTITDAWPIAPGQTWSSHYGALDLPGITLTFE
jgi:2-oxo-3-hexenedioate decarboxylase